jgi:hypothetical protein
MTKLLWSVALVALVSIGVWTGLKASAGTALNAPAENPAVNCGQDATIAPDCCPECPPDCCPDCPPCPFCD